MNELLQGLTFTIDLPIQSASNISPDLTLKGDRIKITLNTLRAADYPGGGTHQILFDFYAQNQLPDTTEHLHFDSTHIPDPNPAVLRVLMMKSR